jgi:hypothetical protein
LVERYMHDAGVCKGGHALLASCHPCCWRFVSNARVEEQATGGGIELTSSFLAGAVVVGLAPAHVRWEGQEMRGGESGTVWGSWVGR